MKRFILAILLAGSSLMAYDYGYNNSNSNNDNSGYQGDSGRNYQYDMTNQNDRQQYSVDTDAQMRDNSADGYVDRFYDNSQGQYGGGIYGN
ncbi:MAG: hypothetical protein U9Q29_00290 [Campylobacterota bacterium]|nr:hypothetical protein [Campylobacterota bacterium]